MNELKPWQSRLQWPLLLCVFLFGVTGMTMKGGANIFLFLMTLFSLPLLKDARGDRWTWALFIVLSASLLVTVLQLAAGMSFVGHKALDAPTRFFLAALCLFALKRLPARRLATACWGVWLGALGVMVWGYVSTHVAVYAYGLDVTRGWNQFSNPIPFGVFSVMLGFLSLSLPIVGWTDLSRKLQWLLCIGGLLAGLLAGYYSGSRAPFLIVPPLLIVMMLGVTRWRIGRIFVMLAVILAATASSVMITPNKLHSRIDEGLNDLRVYKQNQNTSMGLRLEMWRVARDIIADHPLTGVGKQGYYDEVNARIKQGKAPVIINAAPHPHGELLNFGVEMGLPGLILGLLIFAVPAALFFPLLRADDALLRFAATGGSIVVVGQFVAGLMDTYFWIVSQTAFYGTFVVVFAAIILARRQELAGR
ncbi:O-antigen ligase family protein [Chromobacterium sinusclupearum]|uniref:O-antigen ligase family protein n=1 Tax=Chromobacterium sinusclupearum TaxID=2077146 RepID=UPI001304E820|nr:O-antigen ligase family protein [Chromobacterium sinusclupearum]